MTPGMRVVVNPPAAAWDVGNLRDIMDISKVGCMRVGVDWKELDLIREAALYNFC